MSGAGDRGIENKKDWLIISSELLFQVWLLS